MVTNEDPIPRHERWLEEHEAMIRQFDRNMLELQAMHKALEEKLAEEHQLTWASFRSAQELPKEVVREGNERMKALDAKLDRLADLMIGKFGTDGGGQ